MRNLFRASRRWMGPFPLLALLLLGIFLSEASASELTVQVRNLKTDQGQIRIAVFNRAEGFPRAMFQGQIVPAQPGYVTVIFKDLPPGAYAVSAYHDVNGNEKLDSNMLGIPSEPYGFSRNARGTMGPPKFSDSRIDVGTQPLAIELELN